MQFKNILKNRFYVFPSNENIFDEDASDLIKKIFEDARLGVPERNQIELIDSNYNYDIYKVYFADKNACLKISFDSDSNLLKKEFDFYDKSKNSIHPEAIAFNSLKYGDLLNYSITSYEKSQSINKISNSILLENLNLIFDSINTIHSFSKPSENINLFVNSFFKYFDLNGNIPQHTIDILKNKYNFNLIKNLIKSLKKELKDLVNSLTKDSNTFCHGNLKPSNILFDNEKQEIKIINFENNFYGHKYFDIASLSINMSLSPSYNKDFFKSFLAHNKIPFSPKELESYYICYNILLRKTLIELLINYFFENYVLGQTRGSKIYQIISLYTYNVENFYKIPSFRENYNFFSSIFSEAVIGDENE
jgi:thiamine kinase-like enzyme